MPGSPSPQIALAWAAGVRDPASGTVLEQGGTDMKVDATTQIVIDRPSGDVAGYAGDPQNAPEWYANIRSVRWVTPPPVGVGSQLDFVASFLGRRLAYTYLVKE